MTRDNTSLGARLRDVREYLGVSPDAVLAGTGIDERQLIDIEAGTLPVGELELGRLARLYGYPAAHFRHPAAPLDESTVHVLTRLTDGLTDADRQEALRFAAYLRDATED